MSAISILAEACSGSDAVEDQIILMNQQFPSDECLDSSIPEESFQTKTSSRGNWTAEEDELLRNAVQQFGGRNWKKISDLIEDRTDVQCLHRWQKVLRPGLIKGPWTIEEDNNVVDLVSRYGVKSWSFIARQLKGRLGKQCRERWYNHLNPDIVKTAWSEEEDRIIIEVVGPSDSL